MSLPHNYAAWQGVNRSTLQADSVAAGSIAILLIPQAIAYAALAGMPASAGAVAAIAGPIGFLALGGTRYLSVGPVALLALMAAESAGRLTSELPPDVLAGSMLAFTAGIALLIMGIARLGFLVHFVSEPVLTGFITAAAVLIGVSQLAPFLGVAASSESALHISLMNLWEQRHSIQLVDLTIASIALALLVTRNRLADFLGSGFLAFILRRAMPLLLVVAAGVLVAFVPDIQVATVKPVKLEGMNLLPVAGLLPALKVVLPDALAIAGLALVVARGVQMSTSDDPDDRRPVDFHAGSLGTANIASGFFSGMPVGISVSRSAILAEVNARTPLAALAGGLLAGGTLIFAGNLLQYLPKALLAALIISALPGIIDVERIKRPFKFHLGDAVALSVTVVLVLFLGIQTGIVAGALTSLGYYLYRTSQPRVVRVGEIEASGTFRDVRRPQVVDRTNGNDEDTDHPVAIRIDEEIYFGNAGYCEAQIHRYAEEYPDRAIILDMRSVGTMDSTAVAMLIRVREDLAEQGCELKVSTMNRRLQARLRLAGLLDEVADRDQRFESVEEAVQDEKAKCEESEATSQCDEATDDSQRSKQPE